MLEEVVQKNTEIIKANNFLVIGLAWCLVVHRLLRVNKYHAKDDVPDSFFLYVFFFRLAER